MKELVSKVLKTIQRRREEIVRNWQQRADGYSHLRGDDSGDEPDHTPPGSPEWSRWTQRRGYK